MSTGANEINTINRTVMAGSAMVARVVLGSAVFCVKCSSDLIKNFFAAVAGSDSVGGKETLAALLKSGEPLEVYSFTEDKFKLFGEQAKRYGIAYSVVKRDAEDKINGTYDVMIKRSDAGKLSRVLDKIGYSTVETDAYAETVSSEENINKEPDGMTVTPGESRKLVELMLEPDTKMMGNSQNPGLSAEREPLSADILPEKRNSVAERLDNIKNIINNRGYDDSEINNNLVQQMLSGFDEEKNKEENMVNIFQNGIFNNSVAGKENSL